MSQVETLIARAAAACGGSRYQLAQRLHVSQGDLSNMANGKRPLGPRLAAQLAEVAGDDPREQALAALVEQEKDPIKRERLAQLFRLAPAASKAAIVALLAVLTGLPETASAGALRLVDGQSIARGEVRNGPFPPTLESRDAPLNAAATATRQDVPGRAA